MAVALVSTAVALLVPAADTQGLSVRYFAYGSNLARSVREGRRQLTPLSSAAGFVRDERLAFNVPGFSPAEPSFASIQPQKGEECHGGVFELTVGDWLRVCATEGVPFAYKVREVQVELYRGSSVPAFTLGYDAPPWLSSERAPSQRYLTLIRDGARELQLTPAYQDKLLRILPVGTRARPESDSRSPAAFERRSGSTFV